MPSLPSAGAQPSRQTPMVSFPRRLRPRPPLPLSCHALAGCLELDVVWRFPSAAAALHTHALDQPPSSAAGEEAGLGGLAPAQAASWRLLALSTSYERYTGHRGFVLRAGAQPGSTEQPACSPPPVPLCCHAPMSAAGHARWPVASIEVTRLQPRQQEHSTPSTCSGQAAPLPPPTVTGRRCSAAHFGGHR